MIPNVRFDPAHLTAGGANAPDGVIRVSFACAPADCTAGDYRVDVMESGTQTAIASGSLTCRGEYVRHELPIAGRRPLAAVNVWLRYTCGTRVEDDTEPSTIWIVRR